MDTRKSGTDEQERIRAIYRMWHGGKAFASYAWHRPEILEQEATRYRIVVGLLAATLGHDLGPQKILDVGCGSGRFLRQLINWGARPGNLIGTEYQEDRLQQAQSSTAPGVRWHLGDLDILVDSCLDLAVANCVFSSILNVQHRRHLATEMWRVLKLGGWCMLFDFRYNNPANEHVRKVTRREMGAYWSDAITETYQTLLLAPPIARRLARAPRFVGTLLGDVHAGATFPFYLHGQKIRPRRAGVRPGIVFF